MRDAAVFLMYHELRVPDRALCSDDPGYVRYVVDADVFRAHLEHVAQRGARGMSVSAWLDAPPGGQDAVVITFDDGYETDLATAAPALEALGFRATFYVTAGFVGRRGYLAPAGVRELVSRGHEVGCHSMTHAFLSDLADGALKTEIVDSKDRLEQLTGAPVRSLSCPGGRFDDRVLAAARAAGYESVATSRVMRNERARPAQPLGRVAIMQDTDLRQFDGILDADGFARRRLRDSVLGLAKSMLGNSAYERFRERVLGGRA